MTTATTGPPTSPAGPAKAGERLRVVTSRGLPAGWTGKLWAVKQGIDAAMALPQPPDYLLLTDADIVHAPDSVTRLVAHAEAKSLVLTSLMVKLRCESLAERANIPAFIFFFQMLYPFSWVNRPQSQVAAAAGGCMLVRADVLRQAGGIEVIRGALIDDCALAKALKAHGPIWLGLTERVHSIRPYPALGDIRRMVARSAYAQLRYSPLLLSGTVAGMVLTYLAPPLLAIFGSGAARDPRACGLGVDGHRVSADVAVLPAFPFMGHRAPCYCPAISALHPQFRLSICARTGRKLEGARASQRIGTVMITAAEARSGKGHRDENFPVASRLIHPRHRGAILAFYEFVRTADDIADHPSLAPQEKLALLDRLEATLLGRNDDDPVGVALRTQLAARSLSPRHAQDLLTAFRMDVTKLRYRDWDDLIGYCTYSAMPVGRFVLDVHGESRATWPANDALCAALQIINHLQDCGKDYRDLDRVYIPLDAFAEAGRDRGGARRRPCFSGAARLHPQACAPHRGSAGRSRPFSAGIDDIRLALEVAVIQTYAERLVGVLGRRDPLSERVHLGKAGSRASAFSAYYGVQPAASAASSRPATNRRMPEHWR